MDELDQSQEAFQIQLQRLHQVTVYGRWALVGSLWLLVGLPCLWLFRAEIELWLEYFTWTAVRYSLAYNTALSIGLSLCVGSTVAVLVWQSRNILWGMPPKEQQRLQQQLAKIRQQGSSHPLWPWVMEGKWR